MSGAAAIPRVTAVLLAAGASRRFGPDNKLLAEIDGGPLVVRSARALAAAAVIELVVVTGYQADHIAAALRGVLARLVFNARHREGIGTSIATGIGALSSATEGVLIAQADMPGLATEVIDRLIGRFAASGCDAVIVPVASDGQQGNPILWPRRCFAKLAALDGDRGGKHLLTRSGERIEQVPVTDDHMFLDVDTMVELEAARDQIRRG